MAIVQDIYTGNGSTTIYSLSFPYLEQTDVVVTLNGTVTTAYTFTSSNTIQFTTAPGNGVTIKITRNTELEAADAVFYPGSTIRAQDLNDNFTQLLYVAQEVDYGTDTANTTANTALTNANAAVSTANTASTNATAAVNTANTASTNASSAVSTANAANATANTALTTANTASTNASTAVTTANTASTNASAALSAANSAVTTANTASTNAAAAVSTANTASSNASAAVTTANSAVTTANTALTSANNAVSNSNTAVSTATSADIKATQAIAAVASAALYTVVANVAAIPVSPANNTAIEVTDSTGIQSFTPLTGLPAGFVGSPGLSVRIIYSTTGPTWNWIQYFPNDPENRYLKLSGGTLTGALAMGTNKVTGVGNPTAAQDAATKSYVDAADTILTSAAAAAQTTANDALPKAGGTMTGNITFNGAQTFPGTVTSVSGTAPITVTGTTTPTVSVSAASTAASGVVQLTDSTSSTSTTTAATPNSVKTAYDLANAALPKAGGTVTGDVRLDNRSDLRFGEATANGSNYVGFQAPANIPSDVLWTLPATDAAVSGYALKSDGAGNLSWGLAGGAAGGGANQIFYENDQTVTTNYTITAGKNAMTAGPVTINNSVVVTVPSGSSWVIV